MKAQEYNKATAGSFAAGVMSYVWPLLEQNVFGMDLPNEVDSFALFLFTLLVVWATPNIKK